MISNLTRMNSFIVREQHKYIPNNLNYNLNELGGNMHDVGLNAGDTQTLHTRLSPNSVATQCQYTCHVVNTKPGHCIKRSVNVDGWSGSQTFSTVQDSSHHICFNTFMLKLDFIMPKVKQGRKTQKRDRSPCPAVSERST